MSGLGNPGINLTCGQMSTFTRFSSLCHLDLNLLCADQISAGNTETSTGYLLDRRTSVKSISAYFHSVKVFTTFTTVGFTMQGVHGDCQSLMRFFGNRTIGHRTCLETGHDTLYTLNFINRNTFFRIIKVHQTTQVLDTCLIINKLRIFLEHLIIAQSRRLL